MSDQRQGGFTLIEVMVVAAILAVLVAIVVPSYQDQVQRSRRADAQSMLSTAANFQERQMTRGGQYTTDTDELGGATSESDLYRLTVADQDSGTVTVSGGGSNASIDINCSQDRCYVLAATAIDAQISDADCAHFTLDHLGRQRSFDAGGNQNTAGSDDPCW